MNVNMLVDWMKELDRSCTDLENNAISDRSPMQSFKKWYRVRETRRSGNYLCKTILYTLKFQDVLERNVMIKGIVIIKFTTNKSSCSSFGNSKTYIGEYDEGHECNKSSNNKFVKYAV